MGLIKDKYEKTMQVEGEWNIGAYRYKAPEGYLDEFVRNFREKRIIGTLCRGCGRVYVPPREICARCFMKIDEKVEVSQHGEVLGFLVSPPLEKGKVVIAGIDAVQAGFLKEGEQIILAMVRFEGTSSSLVLPLLNVEPEKVRLGMRVRAVWAEECKGALSDLLGVEPAFEVRFE